MFVKRKLAMPLLITRRRAGSILAGIGVAAALAACAPTEADMSERAQPSTVRVEPGTTLTEVRAGLGEPAAAQPLRTDQPEVMGARVVSYVRQERPIEFILKDGQRRQGTRLDLVLDPDGRVLRLVDNPNPLPGDGGTSPVMRGRPGFVVAALVPVR